MRLIVISTFLAVCALAQRGGGVPVGGLGPGVPVGAIGPIRAPGAAGAGFGNILFPGGAPGHATALGATVRGVAPVGAIRGGGAYGNRGYGGRAVIVPYPVYASPMYGGSYAYGYDQTMYAEQPQQAPVVIINQNFKPDTITPVVREYTNLPPAAEQLQPSATLKVYENRTGPQAAASDEPTIFLIAMKEGNIMPALAFWVEGDTLHYITRESSHNRISLDRVDREFSVRLNKERNLEFRIP